MDKEVSECQENHSCWQDLSTLLCSPALTPPRRAAKAIKRKSKWFAKQNDFIIWGKGGQLLKTSASQLMKALWQHLLQRLFPARTETPSAWPEKGRQGLCIEEELLISPSGWGHSQDPTGKQTIKNDCVKNWMKESKQTLEWTKSMNVHEREIPLSTTEETKILFHFTQRRKELLHLTTIVSEGRS